MLERSEVVEINRRLRAADESHLWPICGKFSATGRAIGRILKQMQNGLYIESAAEYEAAVDEEISRIVNDPDNW